MPLVWLVEGSRIAVMSIVTGLLALTHVGIARQARRGRVAPMTFPVGAKGNCPDRPQGLCWRGPTGGTAGEGQVWLLVEATLAHKATSALQACISSYGLHKWPLAPLPAVPISMTLPINVALWLMLYTIKCIAL